MSKGALYLIIGLLLGLLILAFVMPHGTVSSGTSGNQDLGYTNTPTLTPTPEPQPVPPYDPEHDYMLEASITVRATSQSTLSVTIDEAKIYRVSFPGLPALQWLLSWIESDWTIKAEFVTPNGEVYSKILYNDALAPGDVKTFNFKINTQHWTKGTLRILVIRMDGFRYIAAQKDVSYS